MKPLLTEVSINQKISVLPEMLKKIHLKMSMLNKTLGIHLRRGIFSLHLYSLFKMVLEYNHIGKKCM